jgi:lysophospholipase L1-like esterase
VALGDSTTEGLWDPHPGGGGFRGWADRLAERLAVYSPDLRYANLAVRGRKIGEVHEEQLPLALAMKPDLASVVGGINDMLRTKVDLDAVLAHVDAMAAELRATGATVLLLTYPDTSSVMPIARGVRGRVLAFNDAVRAIATRHGALVIDLGHDGGTDPRLWHTDRLHANAIGHERIADAAAEQLGLPGASGAWRDPLPDPIARVAVPLRLAQEVAWTGRFFAPWVMRRVRGRSSGDGIVAKRPRLEPVDPPRP